MTEGSAPVAALSRGLSLLEVLGAAARPTSLAELARASKLHKTTALRLLLTLNEAGFVERTGGRYVLGPAAFRLGLAYQRSHLLHIVKPALVELQAEDCDSPSFHVRHSSDTRLCLLRLVGRHGQQDGISAGDVLPLLKGAPGRVLAAFEAGTAADDEISVTVSWGERIPNCASVAAPVFGRGDRLYGALSVSGPSSLFTKVTLPRISRRVLHAAATLTARIGGDRTIFQGVLAG